MRWRVVLKYRGNLGPGAHCPAALLSASGPDKHVGRSRHLQKN